MDCGNACCRKGGEMKKCTIKFNETGKAGIEVKFEGTWIRVDLEKARVAMMRELPRYTVKMRENLMKGGSKDARRRTKTE